MELKSNGYILQQALDSGLLRRCVECQFAKADMYEDMEDFFQDMCVIILEYDNVKLNDAYNRHFNAWLSRVIQNNIFSINSPFYKTYRKQKNLTERINNNDDNEDDYED